MKSPAYPTSWAATIAVSQCQPSGSGGTVPWRWSRSRRSASIAPPNGTGRPDRWWRDW